MVQPSIRTPKPEMFIEERTLVPLFTKLAAILTVVLSSVLAKAEPTPPSALTCLRLLTPEVGPVTHVTSETSNRVWLLSEKMDVLVVEGHKTRKVRDGSWAFTEFNGPFQEFEATSVAASDSALVIAGTHRTPLGSNFTAFARIPLNGRIDYWMDMAPAKRFTARVQLGSRSEFSDWVEWASGARTYVGGFLGSRETMVLESPSRIIAYGDDIIQRFDGWTWTSIPMDPSWSAALLDRSDALWVIDDKGVRVSRNGVWTAIHTPNPFTATSMRHTGSDGVWFLGPQFVAVWNGQTIVPVNCPIHEMRDLWQTRDGSTYFVGSGTQDGSTAVYRLPSMVSSGSK